MASYHVVIVWKHIHDHVTNCMIDSLLKLINNLLEVDPSARAIISTGYANDPIMITFEEYGFKGAIAKPYEAVELSRVLHDVMAEEES